MRIFKQFLMENSPDFRPSNKMELKVTLTTPNNQKLTVDVVAWYDIGIEGGKFDYDYGDYSATAGEDTPNIEDIKVELAKPEYMNDIIDKGGWLIEDNFMIDLEQATTKEILKKTGGYPLEI